MGNYVLIGAAVLMAADLVWEGIEEGKWKWYKFGMPVLFIGMAIANFGTIHMLERKLAEKEAASDPARDSGSGNP